MNDTDLLPNDHEPPQPDSLARQVRRAAEEFASVAGTLTEEQWRSWLPAERKSVSALVHHVAGALDEESRVFVELAHGVSSTGWTSEWLDAQNREQALLYSQKSKDDGLSFLVHAAERAAERVATMTREGLLRSATHMPDEPARSVAKWIESCMISHPREHLEAIRTMQRGKDF